jgi:hypothetical protein
MSRILNEAGEYTPEAPVVVVPDSIDPETLPQIRGDRYANVDPTDFSTAIDMSRRQMLILADIAARRNQPQVALRWKQLATEQVRRDNQRETNELAERLAKNTYVGEPGSGIVEPTIQTPWHQDSEYQSLAHAHREKAAEIAEMNATDPDYFIKSSELLRISNQMTDREAAVREQTPSWTQQDDMVLAANQSLVEKSKQVTDMMRG